MTDNSIQTFNPVLLSDAENRFLRENIGLPTIVALRKLPITGVSVAAVRPILDRVNELNASFQHDGEPWIGVDKIKSSIDAWLTVNAKWANDAKRSRKAPRWPSRYSYDVNGRAHLGGPGSDSSLIKTYFGPAGERIPFEVDLFPDYRPEWTPPGFTEKPLSGPGGLHIDDTSHRIECRVPLPGGKVCGHAETYKADSRASYNAARARMSKHLRKATDSVEEHREVHTNEFGA